MPFFSVSSVGTNIRFHPLTLPWGVSPTCSSSTAHASSLDFLSTFPYGSLSAIVKTNPLRSSRFCASSGPKIDQFLEDPSPSPSPTVDATHSSRGPADWEAAKLFKESGYIYEGRVEGLNAGGLRIRFYSLVGFLPFPQLSPSRSFKEPQKSIREIAKGLIGSTLPMKVIEIEENKKLIFSEKEAVWSKYSSNINVGDIFEARVGNVEVYGAFVYLRFPDGLYHLKGLVHVSEVSWDLIHDVRDILREGENVKVKVIGIDRKRARLALSIKQLEEDPLFETIDKVIPQDEPVDLDTSGSSTGYQIEPLPGLKEILDELLKEEGISKVKIRRQGYERRVVSQDLQLWVSNAPAVDKQFTILARAGRQVQEIQLTTALDQEGIKKSLQRVLARVP